MSRSRLTVPSPPTIAPALLAALLIVMVTPRAENGAPKIDCSALAPDPAPFSTIVSSASVTAPPVVPMPAPSLAVLAMLTNVFVIDAAAGNVVLMPPANDPDETRMLAPSMVTRDPGPPVSAMPLVPASIVTPPPCIVSEPATTPASMPAADTGSSIVTTTLVSVVTAAAVRPLPVLVGLSFTIERLFRAIAAPGAPRLTVALLVASGPSISVPPRPLPAPLIVTPPAAVPSDTVSV